MTRVEIMRAESIAAMRALGAEELAPWRVPTRSVYLARWVTL